ncbi:MAG: decaprenyl-phosphate phosphoribosyltransferase [Actinomycetota bacterium]|nr:decaprenyl-phosphate phosphoribosyltransferase [Actinomycetota bacterium]
MRPLIASLRPQEWVKNVLVFAGIVFSRSFDEAGAVADVLVTFVAFCAVSSAGYLFNDLRDVEHDRRHPDKRTRPIASGALSETVAGLAAVVLALFALGLPLVLVSAEVTAIVGIYAVVTILYSIVLKRLVIIDVMTISGLFILRVLAGAVAVGAGASEFLLVCTAMLALFLGFTKRRQEAILEDLPPAKAAPAGSAVPVTRPVLEHYSLPFLDQMIAMVTATALISYVLYAVDSPIAGSKMLATAPSVLYGVFRYLYLIYDRRDTRSTAAIIARDPGVIFAGVTYVASALVVLYVLD